MEKVTSEQLLSEIGSLYMALKVVREERDALKSVAENLKKQVVALMAEVDARKVNSQDET